jgi:predicted dehydrogenase
MIDKANAIGPLRKVLLYYGHQGPKEIGCSQPFLNWLTDPQKNGGGAIIDFGCYGANVMNWLTQNEKPISVTAQWNRNKPEIYPKVDDVATIILQYPQMQAIIQASWNWSYSRKDMELFGTHAIIQTFDAQRLQSKIENETVQQHQIPLQTLPFQNAYDFFVDVIQNNRKLEPRDLSSLDNNLRVVEILEAARQSAQTGKTIYLKN